MTDGVSGTPVIKDPKRRKLFKEIENLQGRGATKTLPPSPTRRRLNAPEVLGLYEEPRGRAGRRRAGARGGSGGDFRRVLGLPVREHALLQKSQRASLPCRDARRVTPTMPARARILAMFLPDRGHRGPGRLPRPRSAPTESNQG